MSNQYLLLIDKSVAKLLSLAFTPKPQDCKSLKGVEGGYRVDSGESRILYYLIEPVGEQRGQVQIFRVGKRNFDLINKLS
jgi:mRNA interferase RelE/StbE